MSDNKKKILEMLEQKKITADEAYRLLRAVDSNEKVSEDMGHGSSSSKRSDVKEKPQYLRVTITPGENKMGHEQPDRVNVRVPMSLVRAGVKLTSLIPPEALDKANQALHEKGIDFDVRTIKPDDIEDLIEALGDMEIDIEGNKGEKFKVFVE
jgi:hypothetical protein